jgi:hypothetical protein
MVLVEEGRNGSGVAASVLGDRVNCSHILCCNNNIVIRLILLNNIILYYNYMTNTNK